VSGDLKTLQGRRRVVGLEIDGAALPAAALSRAEIHLEGDRFTSSGMGAVYRGALAANEPRTLQSVSQTE